MRQITDTPVPENRPAISADINQRFKLLRWEAFFLTWLIYVAFYLVRKNFDGAKPGIIESGILAQGLTVAKEIKAAGKESLGWIASVYLICYTIGQFVAGALGDWLGAKRVVIGGMLLSVLANIAFGLSSSLLMMSLALALNGFAKACGFPLCCKLIATWFPPSMRGRAASWFLTSYTLGEIMAKSLAGAMIQGPGWRYAFFAPAGIVFGILMLLALRLKPSPQSVGLPDIATFSGEAETASSSEKTHGFGSETLALFKHPAIWVIVSSYFLLKMARYTLNDWSNVYLFEQLHYNASDSTFATIPISIGGLIGTLSAGYASDRFFQARRAPIVVIYMVLLAITTIFYAQLGPGQETRVIVLHTCIGFFAYGADAVLSASCSMDIGSSKGAASAAGIINGFGALGTVFSPSIGAFVSTRFGWTDAWYFLAGILIFSAGILSTRWNRR